MNGRLSKKGGFSLIEVTLAIGIAAFCLIVIFALLPTGLNSNQSSVQQTIAAGLAAGIAADLRSVPQAVPTATGPVTSPRYAIDPRLVRDFKSGETLYLKEDGSIAESDSLADYAVQVGITPPTGTSPIGPTQVRIRVAWPAKAKKESASFFEAVTALDLNP